MSVTYSLAELRNPSRPSEAKKFYARAQSAGRHDLNTICESISRSGTIIRGDVLAVSDGLIYEMQQGLRQGKVVELGDFGHFQIQLSSEGAEAAKDFKSTNIKKVRIQFRPGPMLKNMMKTLEYEQVSPLPKKETPADDDAI